VFSSSPFDFDLLKVTTILRPCLALFGPAPKSMDQLGDKVAAEEFVGRVDVSLIQDSNKDISKMVKTTVHHSFEVNQAI
jgi:acetyl/propionyl-CoA carboxylase alpha subunit